MSFARRIVLDTGVLVSAAIRPDSVPALALEKAFLNYDVCVSLETLGELTTVLGRSKFDRYTPPRQRDDFVAGFRARAVLVEVITIVTDCVDPKDNVFLALAETAEADLIVSSDPHLTSLHPWRGIPIIPPAAFLVGIR
ncbi:MAG: putative toxin-antitoxin system toxin component, PIN family [Thiohalocapsa sp.]